MREQLLYGLGRIAQVNGTTPKYILADALGSVRQLTDASGTITYARAYDPYGVVTTTGGASQSAYGYTGEYSEGEYSLHGIYRHSQHCDKMRRGGEHHKDVPHLMEAEHSRGKVENFGHIHNCAE